MGLSFAFPLLRSRLSGCCCDGLETNDGFRQMACDVAGFAVTYGRFLATNKKQVQNVLDRDARCRLSNSMHAQNGTRRVSVKVLGSQTKERSGKYDGQENALIGSVRGQGRVETLAYVHMRTYPYVFSPCPVS